MRCSDNLNILSNADFIWMPNAGEVLPAAKSFENAANTDIPWGWDGCNGGAKPYALAPDQINTAQGVYPDQYKDGLSSAIFDTRLNSYNIQIVSVNKTMLSESYCVGPRPSYAMASLPRDKGPLAFYTRTHTIYAPMSRMDYYTALNYRRPREGARDYRGSLVWHEGQYVFTKDVTLKGAVPIVLVNLTCPTDLNKGWGTSLVVKEQADRSRFALSLIHI